MKKSILAVLIAAVLMLSLVGCGGKDSSGSAQFGAIEATLPDDLESVTIEAPDYNPGDIEAIPPEGLESVTIEAPDYNFGDIEANLPEGLESVTIEAPEYDFGEVKTILPSGDMTGELHMPDYHFSEITVKDVTLSVPVIDYEISFDKIGSAYTDTYTVPSLQVEVPDFDKPELEDVFVSIANHLSPEDQVTLAGMSDTEFAEIAAVHLSLTDALLETYKFEDITLAIDPLSGAIPIDASLLFDTDKYELKPEGKAALKAAFTVYYSVISDPEYRDAVDAIVIEGHTDTEGNYEYNQQLSEKRAEAVRDFLLSDECGLPNRDYLASLLTTVGRSYDNPVYAPDGTVDMAASRRVEIHYTLNLEP